MTGKIPFIGDIGLDGGKDKTEKVEKPPRVD